MKKSIIAALLIIVTIAACRKRDGSEVSTVVTESHPTISFSAGQYYSINTGGAIPVIAASAYDSTLRQSYPVTIIGQSAVKKDTPGLYVIQATAQNANGYVGSRSIYIAVTNVNDVVNLAGTYKRTSNSEPAHVTRLARGLYQTDDVGGAPTLEVAALFVHINDTLIDVPSQPTIAGTLSCQNEKLKMAPGDTTFTYIVINPSFGTAARTFKKQ